MKLRTVLMPLLLPRLSDSAAVHLVHVIAQFTAAIEHHYAHQIHRHHQLQALRALCRHCTPPENHTLPF